MKKRRVRWLVIKIPAIPLIALLLLCTSLYSYAQGPVRGKVVGKDGEPIPSATITVKGKNVSATADFDGSYSIIASSGDTLVVSSVGYEQQSFAVGVSPIMDITMTEKNNTLDDVVVVGYTTQRRGSVTGAISTIDAGDIVRTPVTTTSAALVGKLPGITTRAADSRPGNGINLQIRNMGNPLFVIDGVPYGGTTGTNAFGFTQGSGQDIFNNLGLDDIESITILKDASASIYGLRASNGVVLITTKKGKLNEKPSINLSGYYGFQNFTRFPHPANAGQYVRALVESEQNLGNDPSLLYSPEELAKWEAGTDPGYKSYDYYDITFRPNVPQYFFSANTSGGSQRSKYYLSASHISQDAIIRDYSFERTNIQANIESSVTNRLKVGTQISARLEKIHNVGVPGLDDYFNPFLSVLSMWPTESPYANDNPRYINQTHNVNVNPATYRDDITGYVDEWWRAININLNAQYEFPFGLTAKAVYSHNYMNEEFDGFEYTWDAYKYNPTTDTYETEPGFGNQNPWRERHKRNVTSRYAQVQLSYNKQIQDHSIAAVVAYERSDYDNAYYVVHTVPTNNYIPIQFLAEEDYLSDEWTVEARAGYIGRLNYDYKQKYLLELLARYDGSYLYDPDNRWGFFPGVSVGWRISEEPFLRDKVSFLTDLKLRVSYGETGSELGVSAFGYLPGYTFNSGNAVLNGSYVIGLRPRGLPVTNLSWVTNRTKNIGIDFTLWNGMISGQFDVFERKRTGLPAPLYDVLLPSEVGYGLPNENLESDATRGVEGMLSWKGQSGQFSYSVSANASYARLRILDRYKPRFGNSWDEYRWNIEDRWSGVFWGYHVIGRFESEEQIKSYGINNDQQGNRTALPGDLMYEDVNGDKIINDWDQRPIGYALGAQPYVSFGLSLNGTWKGVSLQLDFAGATMQSFLRDWELRYPFQNNGSSPAYMFADRWHRADPYDPNSAWIAGTYPAIRKNSTSHSNYWANDFWLTNVRYIRLRNCTVGYDLPRRWLDKAGFKQVRFYVAATNLFSIDNVKQYEIDPEISSANGLVYPQQKLLNIGFNVSL